ncbi:MAG: hypothetical protein JW849_01870 [Phycisphaerae bacterium]|nr:hypothetical protein [Phycisphaerae bacterium]
MKADASNQERFPAAGGEPETSVPHTDASLFGRRVHRSTLLIGLMFALGAGWVLWESRTVGPKPAAADADPVLGDPTVTMSLDQMRMDAAIGAAHEARTKQLFAPFLNDLERRRLRLHALPRDPFAPPAKKEAPAAKLAANTTGTPATIVEAPPDVEHLELRSILIGASPTAIINGYLLQEGQVIDQWKVVEIQPEQVVLQWRDRKHVLKMP